MRRSAWIIPSLLVAWLIPYLGSALAQPAGGSLDDKQLLGMRLFNQSCRVCHTKPQMTSPQYGPVLSRVSLGGNDEAMKVFIANGSARMPGFRYHFKAAEIDAIVSYLKSLPASD